MSDDWLPFDRRIDKEAKKPKYACPSCGSVDIAKTDETVECKKCRRIGTTSDFLPKPKKSLKDWDESEAKKRAMSVAELKAKVSQFGVLYMPEDVREKVDDIAGNEDKKERLDEFFLSLKGFCEFAKDLTRANLYPSLTFLLYGIPGTGKTALTRAFAKKYNVPICVVQSSKVVDALLGATLKNIDHLFGIAKEIARSFGEFVLFFDELDALGSERSARDIGEIKRATITFLQCMDECSYDGLPVAIFGATNHEGMLDTAVWRRFDFHLHFDYPNFHLRKKILDLYLNKIKSMLSSRNRKTLVIDGKIEESIESEYAELLVAEKELNLASASDEDFWKKAKAKTGEGGLIQLTAGYSGSDIQRGFKTALFKALLTGRLDFDHLALSLKLVGGSREIKKEGSNV